MKHTKLTCKLVRERILETLDKCEYPDGKDFEVYIVACGHILGYEKYWISTDLPNGKYFEVTYNAQAHEFYIDEYVRVSSRAIKE